MRRTSRPQPRLAAQRRASFDPPSAQFGDAIAAHVVVLADRRALDTGGLRIALRPLAALAGGSCAHVTDDARSVAYRLDHRRAWSVSPRNASARGGPRRLRLAVVRARGSSTRRRHGARDSEMAGARGSRPCHRRRSCASRLPSAATRVCRPSHTASRLRRSRVLLDVLAAVLVAAGSRSRRERRSRTRDAGRPSTRAATSSARLRSSAKRRPVRPEDRRLAVGLLARLLRSRDASVRA